MKPRKKLTLKRPRSRRPRCRLTPEQVINIRALASTKLLSYRFLAGMYHVSHGTVRDVIKGITWRHLQ